MQPHEYHFSAADTAHGKITERRQSLHTRPSASSKQGRCLQACPHIPEHPAEGDWVNATWRLVMLHVCQLAVQGACRVSSEAAPHATDQAPYCKHKLQNRYPRTQPEPKEPSKPFKWPTAGLWERGTLAADLHTDTTAYAQLLTDPG